MSPPLQVWLQHLLPKRLLCRAVHGVARSRADWVKRPLIGWFARHYAIDMSEAEHASLDAYPSFNAFFTRALKPGARPLEGGDTTVVAPADGVITEFGRIRAGQLVQAKGLDYSLTALLGETPEAVAPYLDGEFLTIYLAPHNYHRVHAPLGGELVRTRYLPGRRYGVNAATAAAIRGLFSRNERVVCSFRTPAGPLAVVLVGALNVASLSTAALGDIPSGKAQTWPHDPPIQVGRGDEVGRFNLGSTVVLVFGRGAVEWRQGLRPGEAIRFGRAIGTVRARATADV